MPFIPLELVEVNWRLQASFVFGGVRQGRRDWQFTKSPITQTLSGA
jgi:hypothetical protein